MELHCWHHGAEIHCLAPTVAVRLGFGGSSWSHHHGRPHHFVPCLTGWEANNQLIEVGDDVSGRVIVPLMVGAVSWGLAPSSALCSPSSGLRQFCQKARTNEKALISRASHHASHFFPWAACPTLCNMPPSVS